MPFLSYLWVGSRKTLEVDDDVFLRIVEALRFDFARPQELISVLFDLFDLFERLVQGLVQILNRVVLDFWRNDTIGKGELSPVSEDLVNEN